MNYLLETLVLSLGWFIFKLQCKEDMGRIIQKPWSFRSTPILFNTWTLMFDSGTEKFGVIPIWV